MYKLFIFITLISLVYTCEKYGKHCQQSSIEKPIDKLDEACYIFNSCGADNVWCICQMMTKIMTIETTSHEAENVKECLIYKYLPYCRTYHGGGYDKITIINNYTIFAVNKQYLIISSNPLTKIKKYTSYNNYLHDKPILAYTFLQTIVDRGSYYTIIGNTNLLFVEILPAVVYNETEAIKKITNIHMNEIKDRQKIIDEAESKYEGARKACDDSAVENIVKINNLTVKNEKLTTLLLKTIVIVVGIMVLYSAMFLICTCAYALIHFRGKK